METARTGPVEAPVGIYIKTFRGDYHLARGLIASLHHYAPGVPIVLVPDDDYEGPTLWSLPVMHTNDSFLLSLTGYLKKFWVFYGPFERFLYLDADQIALKSISPLIDSIASLAEPFLLVDRNPNTQQTHVGNRTQALRQFEARVGELDHLRRFDPGYEWEAHYPFSSGDFGGSRGAIPKDVLEATVGRLRRYHEEHGLPLPGRTRVGPLSADQGLLNYLARRHGVNVHYTDGMYVWGGISKTTYRDRLVASTSCSDFFVHWGGCPRPSVIPSPSVPASAEWRSWHREFYGSGLATESFAMGWLRDVVRESRYRSRLLGSRVSSRIRTRYAKRGP